MWEGGGPSQAGSGEWLGPGSGFHNSSWNALGGNWGRRLSVLCCSWWSGESQARIYREIFERVQLSPVHFLRLMDAAERRVVLKGNDLIQDGRPHEEMFLIVEGQAEVRSEGVAVSHLQSGGFVGSMAFNRFIKKTTSNPHADREGHYVYKDGGMFRKAWEAILAQLRKQGSVVGEVTQSIVGDQKSKRQEKSALERSTTTVTATSDMVVYVWDQHALREFIKRRPMIGASLQKAISVDLVNKVVQSRDHKEHYRQLLAETLDGGRVTSTERKNLQRWVKGRKDGGKVSLLGGCTCDGRWYREGHGISMAEHFQRLKENNWTHKEFQAGFREGVAPKDLSENFLKYEALLRNELAKGEYHFCAFFFCCVFVIASSCCNEPPRSPSYRQFASCLVLVSFSPNGFDDDQLNPEAKSNLRKFRSQKGIDAQEHLIAVEKQGWTADEYEAGKGNNWGDRYDVGGTAVPDLIPYDSEEMADFVEEASIAEKERYRFLLLAALGGGVIQKAEKEKLELYREMHAIPDEEHNRLLFEQGWKPEEYDAGFHKDIASSHFQRYASLVKRELDKGKVTSKAKSNLRKFRTQGSISPQAHLLAVEKEGLCGAGRLTSTRMVSKKGVTIPSLRADQAEGLRERQRERPARWKWATTLSGGEGGSVLVAVHAVDR
ncbi:unnamed protein product [Ectocarpus sp. CCAP 1310/34]|nr:unnamed protein product [Ectocarpus sp. CCAP 1310/34]